jgi:hypothetical protein
VAFETVKEQLVATIQRRQLTELDRRVSREMLDILLLLRARVSKAEIQSRLRSLGSPIYLRDLESSGSSISLITEIPAKGLPEILGRIDIVTLAAYIFSANRMGEKIVHIVPQRDYALVRPFFETNTLPIPSERLHAYEAVLGISILALGIAGLTWLGFLLSDAFASFPVSQRIALTLASYGTVFVGAFAFFGRLIHHTLPEFSTSLSSRIPRKIASRMLRRIFVGE